MNIIVSEVNQSLINECSSKGHIMNIFTILDPITNNKLFDRAVGTIAMLNPLAYLPGILAIYKAETAAGLSITMYLMFLLIQVVFALVGAKARNHGAFWSMTLSAVLSITAIVLILLK